jgi:hypothetical protein
LAEDRAIIIGQRKGWNCPEQRIDPDEIVEHHARGRPAGQANAEDRNEEDEENSADADH